MKLLLRAVETIKEELRDRIAFFRRENKLIEEQRIEQRTRFDLEMLAEIGFTKGIENYSRHLSGAKQGSRLRLWLITCRPMPLCSSMNRMSWSAN